MQHFVAYHNSEKQGHAYNDGRIVRQGRVGQWSTGRPYLRETLLGNRLWGIEGSGSPKRYRLVSSGIIFDFDKRKRPALSRVAVRADSTLRRTDVTDFSWFKKLLEEQRSFSYGLRKIKDRSVIAALEALRMNTSSGANDGKQANLRAERVQTQKNSDLSAIRRSPAVAREILRQLIPKYQMEDVLNVLVHSVRLAHQEAPSRWGLRLNDSSVMLKVGFVEVLQLGAGWFHILVESSQISKKLQRDKNFQFSRGAPYRNAPGCKTCDIDNVSMIARAYSSLLPAHEGAIRIAALSPIHTSTTKDHSPGLIAFLSQELNTRLSQPIYLDVAKDPIGIPEEIDDEEFEEGAAIQVLVNRYERDPAARQRCISYYGTNCAVCGLSLSERYGSTVNGLIHVHHLTPIASVTNGSTVDPVRDLRPVCPNCHAVIHSTRPPRTVEQVREMLSDQVKESALPKLS
jgi:hypothetical protein